MPGAFILGPMLPHSSRRGAGQRDAFPAPGDSPVPRETQVSPGPDTGQQRTWEIPRGREHIAPCPASGRGPDEQQRDVCCPLKQINCGGTCPSTVDPFWFSSVCFYLELQWPVMSSVVVTALCHATDTGIGLESQLREAPGCLHEREAGE